MTTYTCLCSHLERNALRALNIFKLSSWYVYQYSAVFRTSIENTEPSYSWEQLNEALFDLNLHV